MMVYTFIGILFPYSSIHLWGGYEEAQRHTCTKFMPDIPPLPPGENLIHLIIFFLLQFLFELLPMGYECEVLENIFCHW